MLDTNLWGETLLTPNRYQMMKELAAPQMRYVATLITWSGAWWVGNASWLEEWACQLSQRMERERNEIVKEVLSCSVTVEIPKNKVILLYLYSWGLFSHAKGVLGLGLVGLPILRGVEGVDQGIYYFCEPLGALRRVLRKAPSAVPEFTAQYWLGCTFWSQQSGAQHLNLA